MLVRIEVRRELVPIDEVPAVEVVFGADGVIDPGHELVVGQQVRDGVGDKPAVVCIVRAGLIAGRYFCSANADGL